MNWEFVNQYAWETMGEVRFSPMPKDPMAVDREERAKVTTQTNKVWAERQVGE